jgi:DNA-binding transcriptional regulator YiaG
MTPDEFKALQKGLTNKQAAAKLQVKTRTVQSWRSGTRNISPAMAEYIRIKLK